MKREAAVRTATADSPFGTIYLAMIEEKVCALGFSSQWPHLLARLSRYGAWIPEPAIGSSAFSRHVFKSLDNYFAGDLDALSNVPVSLSGTPFQVRIWRQVRRIRPGATASYGEIADRAGAPGSARAAGRAIGANPVSLIVPCHRIVAGDGNLKGYAGGLDRKRRLLAHEGALL